MRSFQYLRAVDLVTHREGIIQLLMSGLGGLFQSALTISFPILGTLLLVSIVMGLLAKAAPQMDVLTMGFPVSIGVSFLVLFVHAAVPHGRHGAGSSTGASRRSGGSSAGAGSLRTMIGSNRASLPGDMPVVPAASRTPFDVHLQWFAAEDEGRTEEPSEHKIRKAREEGKVARSAEVSSSLVLLAGIAALGLLAEIILAARVQMFTFFLSRAGSPDAFNGGLMSAFMSWLAAIALPVLVVVFVVAILGNVIQVGFLFTREAHHAGFRPHRAAVQPLAPAVLRLHGGAVQFRQVHREDRLHCGHRLPEHHGGAARSSRGLAHVRVPRRRLRSSRRSPSASCWRRPSPSSSSPRWTTGSRGASTWNP